MSRRGSVLENFNIDAMNPAVGLQTGRLAVENRELDMRAAQHKADKATAAKKDATDFIGGLNIDDIGDNTIDILTHKQLDKLKGDLIDMQAKGADVTAIKTEAFRRLPAIANGHTVAKNKYNDIKTGLTNLGKDYPTGDMAKARELPVKAMIKDVVQFDEKGQPISYKDPSIIPEKNYTSDLTNETNLPQWYKPSGGLETHIKALPLTKIGESKKIRNKKGVEVDNNWEGQGSVFSQLKKDENGATVGQEIKFENVPLGKNPDGTVNQVKVLPQEQFDILTGTPTAKADFTLMFNKHLTDELKVDPAKLDPRAKDVLQRQFARDWLEATNIDGHSFITKQAEKQPLPPRISVKVNTGSQQPPVIDVYKTIQSKALDHLDTDKYKPVVINGKPVMGVLQANILDDSEQEMLLKKSRTASGDEKLSIDDVYVKAEPNGETWTYRVSDNKPLVKLTPIGVNVSANQPLGMKSKQEAVKDAQGKETKPEPVKAKEQTRKGKDGKVYKSTDGVTWKAADGTTVTLKQ